MFSADWQFKLYYCTGRQYLVTAQRRKAKKLLEDSLKVIENCSDKIKKSLEHQKAKLHLGVVNRYIIVAYSYYLFMYTSFIVATLERLMLQWLCMRNCLQHFLVCMVTIVLM